jgi:hypothetical protein
MPSPGIANKSLMLVNIVKTGAKQLVNTTGGAANVISGMVQANPGMKNHKNNVNSLRDLEKKMDVKKDAFQK